MTRARQIISLTVCLLVAGAAIAFWQSRQNRVAELQAELAATEQLRAPLDKIVTLQFDDGTPLRDWLSEFTRQSGIAVEIFGSSEQTSLNPPHDAVNFNHQTPLHLRVTPLRAEEFLNLLRELYGVPWVLRTDGSVLMADPQARDEVKDEIVARQFPLPPELRPEEHKYLETLLWNQAKLSVVDEITFTPGGLTLVASHKRATWAERYTRDLLTALERARVPAPQGTDPADPIFQRQWLAADRAVIDELAEVLQRPVSLNVVDMPWPDLAAEISRQVKFPVIVHPRTLFHFQRGDVGGTCRAQNVPLGKLLEEFPAQNGLAIFPAAGGQVLVLGGRDIAEKSVFQIAAAYPVGDLTQNSEGRDYPAQLLYALDKCTDQSTIYLNRAGDEEQYLAFGGRLLIITDQYEVHVQIQRVLAALRQARNKRVRNVALPNQYELLAPHLQAILQQRLPLQYSDAKFADIAQDQLEQGHVPLVPIGEARTLFRSQTPIWCYLPERPLGENLRALCGACGYRLSERHDQLRVHWRNPAELELDYDGLACEVFDLRPGLVPRGDNWELQVAVDELLRQKARLALGNERLQVQEFRDLLITRCEPQQLPQIHEILQVLEERHNAPLPNVWRGKKISTEELYEPLTLWPAVPETLAHDAALQQKLREPVDANFQTAKLGDVLLTLAQRHQLPLVVPSILPDTQRLHSRINYTAKNKPLGQILQDLLGDPDLSEWRLVSGCLMVGEVYRRQEPRPGYWYTVGDLVQPHGPYSPLELTNLLAEKSHQAKVERVDRSIYVYFTGLLWLDGEQADRAWLEEQLRLLRNGAGGKEAQP